MLKKENHILVSKSTIYQKKKKSIKIYNNDKD